MTLQVDAQTRFILAVSTAHQVPLAWDALTISIDGRTVEPRELEEDPRTRLQLFETGPGLLMIDYAAEVTDRAPAPEVSPLDSIVYLRPSRYVQSDTLTTLARETFPGLTGPHHDGVRLVREVSSWVHDRLVYASDSTSPTGGAVETLESGRGVCRDFAHLTAALLRALDVPARLVSVYAPGLVPMDFHAVSEVLIDGSWHLVDGTGLAPRGSMVRIAAGRDAADTAFLDSIRGNIELVSMSVDARLDGTLPLDDGVMPVMFG